jgi:hypothetical protein
MSNRNYFTRPMQAGGRNDPGYGRTQIGQGNNRRIGWPWWLFAAAIVAYFGWQFIR